MVVGQKEDLSCLDKLVNVMCKISYDNAPSEVVNKAKECLADFVAIFSEGTRKPESINLRNALGGKGVISRAEDAALWMGSTARMLDIDDGHRFAMAHPGVAINSAAIAMAITLPGVSGKKLLEAIIKGYEVYCYQGRVINPTGYLKRGVDATCVCGAGAAAIAAGTLMGLSSSQISDAISLAASLAGGLNQSAIDGSAQKYLVAGWGAKLGIAAANLAKHGLGGPSHVFEGRLGFCNAFSPEPNIEYMQNPSLTWDILNVYLKQYACVRRIHATLDAVRTIVERENLDVVQVKQIKVLGGQFLYDAGGYQPKDMAQAQTSVPYAVAIYLKHRDVTDDLIHESLHSEEIAAISDRVTVIKDEEMVNLTKKDSSLWGAAKVVLSTMDGQEYTETKIYPDGDPESPFPEGVIREKFMVLGQNTLGVDGSEKLWKQMSSLEEEPHAGKLFLQFIAKI